MKNVVFFLCLLMLAGFFFYRLNNNQKTIQLLQNELLIANRYIEELQQKMIDPASARDTIKKEKEIRSLVQDFIETKDKNTKIQQQSYELQQELASYEITQQFYPDFSPIRENYSISQYFSENHPAIDFAAPEETSVFSAAAGVVKKIKNDPYFGNLIILDHVNNYTTIYAHLSQTIVQEKMFIKKGERIGTVGNTGNSTSPHLHFEIKKNGIAKNPAEILKLF